MICHINGKLLCWDGAASIYRQASYPAIPRVGDRIQTGEEWYISTTIESVTFCSDGDVVITLKDTDYRAINWYFDTSEWPEYDGRISLAEECNLLAETGWEVEKMTYWDSFRGDAGAGLWIALKNISDLDTRLYLDLGKAG